MLLETSYCKQDNCQVAVSLSNHHASLPVAWRLYLPKEWAVDHERRRKAGIPDEIDFKTKPEIALEQIKAALKAGLSRGVVLMDAAYGCNTDLRAGISALALTYVAGILPNTTVWTVRHGTAAAEESGLRPVAAGFRDCRADRCRLDRLSANHTPLDRDRRRTIAAGSFAPSLIVTAPYDGDLLQVENLFLRTKARREHFNL
jgi:hypothetical protein